MRACHLHHLSNGELRNALRSVVRNDCASTAVVIAHIGEFDARKLYLDDGYPSMVQYCVRELNLADYAAYKRIRAGRAAREFPEILRMLAERRVHLSAVVLVAFHLTPENANELLAATEHKTKAEIEQMLAHRFPKADVPTVVRAIRAAHAHRGILLPRMSKLRTTRRLAGIFFTRYRILSKSRL